MFIHGAGCTGQVFGHQLQAFDGSCAPNLPGHLAPGRGSSIAEFADWIEQYVQLEELDEVALCGHSMGGAVALQLALRRPRWARAVVLLGGGARLRVSPEIFERLEENFELGARYVANFFFADSSEQKIRWATNMMLEVGQDQTVRDFRACDAFDVLDRLEQISMPLLALTGEYDKLTPPKHAAVLADRVPGGRTRMVPGAGHFVMTERPEETNAALRSFLVEA